jgi:hypothetical protein
MLTTPFLCARHSCAAALCCAGAAYFFNAQYAEAVRAYAQGLALEPENAQLKEGLAQAQEAIGRAAVSGGAGGESVDAPAPEAAAACMVVLEHVCALACAHSLSLTRSCWPEAHHWY